MFVAVLSGSSRLTGRVVDVDDVVDGLDDVAVAGAMPLVGWLDGELVAATRVALLVEVEPSKPLPNAGCDLAFLPLLTDDAVTLTRGQAAVGDGAG